MLLDKVLKFYCLLHILINFDVNFWQLILTCNFFFSLASPVVISYNGASGDYPSCTDLAYQAAIADGANIIDCPVQISKDGIPFCFSSINLMEGSTAAQSRFRNRVSPAPELFIETGLFSFSLTWEEIQTLKRKFYLFANSIFLVSQKVRIFFINAWKSWFVLLLRWILVYIDGISYSYLLRWVTFNKVKYHLFTKFFLYSCSCNLKSVLRQLHDAQKSTFQKWREYYIAVSIHRHGGQHFSIRRPDSHRGHFVLFYLLV